MTHLPADQHSTPTPAELREQIEHTRHELGVRDLAQATDVKARVQHRAGRLKEQAAVTAGELRARAAKANSRVQDRLPVPVKEKAVQAAGQARAVAARAGRMWEEKAPASLQQTTARSARLARDNRTVLVTAVAGVTVLWLVSHGRKG
ncbi:DUF3618 domain-containing protein [Streptomyces sp. NPDC048643]|uniref:DUF3618 domain-containing protein n=1 Tax=Streptomyces sp. NPDC048643 TaxID=3155637 RepID=UPI00341263A0